MRIIGALQHRPIALLWSGQVFSAIGDEVYNIAIVWFAASLIGLNAGYISAIQAGAVFLFSVIGGVWADHRDPRRIMILADLVRGGAVLLLPLVAIFSPLTLWVLIPVAILVSSLSAFFTPALAAFLPHLVEDRELLQTTNGLMETTTRLARIVGPGLVSLLAKFIPLVHYFTLDAASFFASAWSIRQIHQETPTVFPADPAPGGIKTALLAGYHLLNQRAIVAYLMYSGALVGAAWLFIFPLGMALLVRERLDSDIGALGTLVFAYGIGNLASILILSNFIFKRPERLASLGRVIGGVGFMLFGLSQNLHQMMFACAVAATGGPMTDIGFNILIQRFYRGREISRVHRFGMALSYGFLLLVLLASPDLFRIFSVPVVILACGSIIVICGAIGLIYFWRGLEGPKYEN